MYVHETHKPILEYIKNVQALPQGVEFTRALNTARNQLITQFGLTGNIIRIDEWLPDSKTKAKQPHPLISPLVLRAAKGDTVKVTLKNEILNRKVGIHLVGPGANATDDGAHVGNNASSLLSHNQTKTYTWKCDFEDVYVFHDGGDFRGSESGTNSHGLFGALVVEPTGSRWTDPETGGALLTGLYADVHQRTAAELLSMQKAPYPNISNPASLTTEYPHQKASFREYVIFFHDEPKWVAPHGEMGKNPCAINEEGPVPEEHHTAGSIMPISYRSEPMVSRGKKLWEMMAAGKIDPTNVPVNEEQHHSSWLFGEPSTPVLKAYLGDPVRIRLVHAGVKETHVFHLHVYEWNAVAFRRESNIIDAITISPQTGHTIVPFYGAGNRQMVPGDVIWHCHLYPHFHHGMWGMFRTFDTRQDGLDGAYFHGQSGVAMTQAQVDAITNEREKNRTVRRIGRYPDGSPIHKLVPLPDRVAPPTPVTTKPGYPLFIEGEYGQKSYRVPWHKNSSAAAADGWAVGDYDYKEPTQLELNAFNADPKPGELFTTFPHADSTRSIHNVPRSQTIKHDIDVLMTPVKYNDHGWWDPHGHLFLLADTDHGVKPYSDVVHDSFHHAVEAVKQAAPPLTDDAAKAIVRAEGIKLEPTEQQPLFLRCNKTNVMELTLNNRLEKHIAGTPFDGVWPKGSDILQQDGTYCTKFSAYKGECGLHVHIVKFDPIACDGASTGWNYMSAPSTGKKLVYRWWADEEFGTIFTHDHLFANFRQKHGLFAALIVEPENATFHDPTDLSKAIVVGQNAVIKYHENGITKAYREFCLGNADWVPLFKLEADLDHGAHAPVAMALNHVDGHFIADVKFTAHGTLSQTKVHYGNPIQPPNHPDAMDDNGVFGVNYRCEPIHERTVVENSIVDPAEWFNSKEFIIEGEHGVADLPHTFGDPCTPVFHTLPGEPIRLRMVQGSHEEQHSFQMHGMRWKRFWKDGLSPLKNQQTLGLSEAFTFDIKEPYGKGDYLWKYASAEDLWLGCWGIIRAHLPTSSNPDRPASILPGYTLPPSLTPPAATACRRFRVEAKAKTIWYNAQVADPFGLVYNLTGYAPPSGTLKTISTPDDEPLVLRCKKGEWIEVEVINKLPAELKVEPVAPELPHGDGDRTISNRVSLHTDMLRYDVEKYDGSNVGLNPDSTIDNNQEAPKSHKYYWFADEEGTASLMDMADFRNHRHHGLVGAIVVEPVSSTPYKVKSGATTAVINAANEVWYGPRVTLRDTVENVIREEMVLIIQDGLRYFLYGNPNLPIGDFEAVPGDPADTEDQGLKGVNYKSQPGSHAMGYAFTPATPLITVKAGSRVKIIAVGGCDKPRNHSFTIHGHSWKEWTYLDLASPRMSSEGGISSGSISTYRFFANAQPGDYMYRSGVLMHVVEQGLWGLIRVV